MAADRQLYIEIVVDDKGAVQKLAQVDAGLRNVGTTARGPAKQGLDDFERSIMKGSAAGVFLAQTLYDVGTTIVRELVGGMRSAVSVASQFQNTFIGLTTVAAAFKQDVNATKQAAIDLASDGLMSMQEAAAGLKNLLSAGFGLPEAIQLMHGFKDIAAFNRQASLDFGYAIVSATEGIKNQNSILVDNAGLTKNLSVIMKEAGLSVSDLARVSSDAGVKQKFLAGLLKEMSFAAGDAAKMADTYSGSVARTNTSLQLLRKEIGERLMPVFKLGTDALGFFVDIARQAPGVFTAVAGAVTLLGTASLGYAAWIIYGDTIGKVGLAMRALYVTHIPALALAIKGVLLSAVGAVTLGLGALALGITYVIEKSAEMRLKEVEAAYVKERLASASKIAGREITDMAEAVRILNAEAQRNIDNLKAGTVVGTAYAAAWAAGSRAIRADAMANIAIREEEARYVKEIGQVYPQTLEKIRSSVKEGTKTTKEWSTELAALGIHMSEETLKRFIDNTDKAAEKQKEAAASAKEWREERDRLFGLDKLAEAQKHVDMIGGLAGVSKLGAQEMAALHELLGQAMDAAKRNGKTIPIEWTRIHDATRGAVMETWAFNDALRALAPPDPSIGLMLEDFRQQLYALETAASTFDPFSGSFVPKVDPDGITTVLDALTGTYQTKIKPVLGFEDAPTLDEILGPAPSLGKAVLGDLNKTLKTGLPTVILDALTGGGNVGRSVGGLIGGTVAGDLIKGLGAEKVTSFLTSKIGGVVGKGLGGVIGGALGSVIPGLGTMVGSMIGPLVGKGISALGGAIKGLFGGVSQQELEGRKAVIAFEEQLHKTLTTTQKLETGNDKWKMTVVAVRDAYLATGRSAADAERDVKALWDSSKRGAEAAERAARKINEALEEQRADAARLEAAIKKYGFTMEELGPKFAQQKLDEQAKELIEDWRVLVNSGIELATVNTRMADSFKEYLFTAIKSGAEIPLAMLPIIDSLNRQGLILDEKMKPAMQKYIQDAIKAGAEIPGALKPIVQTLIDQGELYDGNGVKITDLKNSGITFSQTMTQGFESVVRKLDELIQRLIGAGTAIADLPSEYILQVKVAGLEQAQAEVDQFRSQHSIWDLGTNGAVRDEYRELVAERDRRQAEVDAGAQTAATSPTSAATTSPTPTATASPASAPSASVEPNYYKYTPPPEPTYTEPTYDPNAYDPNSGMSYWQWITRYHQGGEVDPWKGARRAHSGLAIDEVPIIAQAGEGVVSKRGMETLGGAAGLHAINYGGDIKRMAVDGITAAAEPRRPGVRAHGLPALPALSEAAENGAGGRGLTLRIDRLVIDAGARDESEMERRIGAAVIRRMKRQGVRFNNA